MASPNDATRKRLGALLAATSGIIRTRWEKMIERAESPEVIAEIERALVAGNETLAMSIVQNQIATMRPAVAEAFIDAGKEAAEEVVTAQPAVVAEAAAAQAEAASGAAETAGAGNASAGLSDNAIRIGLPGSGGQAGSGGAGAGGGDGAGGAAGGSDGFIARLGIVFDPTNARAAEIMRKETDLFIQQLSDAQMESTREAIASAFERGIGPRQTAQVIKRSIGLTRYQLGIVQNYEDNLRAQTAQSLNQALGYQLRNQARDGTVQAAIEGRRPLREADIQRMVEQYRKNFIRHRAEVIARTESTRVTSVAREESFRQLAEKLGIGHNRIIRVWHATEDDRTREWHADMQDQEAPVGQPFTDGLGNLLMYPGDPKAPPETTICCRCAVTMRIASA